MYFFKTESKNGSSALKIKWKNVFNDNIIMTYY